MFTSKTKKKNVAIFDENASNLGLCKTRDLLVRHRQNIKRVRVTYIKLYVPAHEISVLIAYAKTPF